jgi:hypothetical protein
MQDLITCKRMLGAAGNRNKIQAAIDRVMLADEKHMTAEGKFKPSLMRAFVSLLLSSSLLYVWLTLNITFTVYTGKFFTKEEGQTFLCWLVKKWGAYMDRFLQIRAPAEIAQLSGKAKQLRRQDALVMQRVLMGLMLYLGGGLRKQVFVNLLVDHLQWDENEMVMQVGQEKVACTNASHLPLPPQLFTYIEFFKQRVCPYLCPDPTDPPLALWLSSCGLPISSTTFAHQLNLLIKEFNPQLTTTAIDFRRMTITNLFAGMYFLLHSLALSLSLSMLHHHLTSLCVCMSNRTSAFGGRRNN